jgi:hypothetical protein
LLLLLLLLLLFGACGRARTCQVYENKHQLTLHSTHPSDIMHSSDQLSAAL